MTEAAQGPTWETLGYIVGACGLGAGVLWRAFGSFVPRKEYDKLVAKVEVLEKHPSTCPISTNYVSKDSLKLLLDPIIEEQKHRARSMDKLGNAFVDLQKMVHRMDKSLTAIAVHLKVEMPADQD